MRLARGEAATRQVGDNHTSTRGNLLNSLDCSWILQTNRICTLKCVDLQQIPSCAKRSTQDLTHLHTTSVFKPPNCLNILKLTESEGKQRYLDSKAKCHPLSKSKSARHCKTSRWISQTLQTNQIDETQAGISGMLSRS